MPTQQQERLSASCPNQDWLGIDLGDCDYFVRRSDTDPRIAHKPEPIPGEEKRYNRPSPAMHRAYALAGEYKKQGCDVKRDIAYSVHRIIPPGDRPFYIFVEFVSRLASEPGELPPLDTRPSNARPADELAYVTQTVRVDRKAMKVYRALAERDDRQVSDLLEEIVAAYLRDDGGPNAIRRKQIAVLKELFELQEPTSSTQVAQS